MFGEIAQKQRGNFNNGSRQLIQGYVLPSTAANVIFSAIPQNYNHLQIYFLGQFSSTGDILVTVNSVATSTYDYVKLTSNNNTTTSASTFAAAFWHGGAVQGSGSTPNFTILDFPFYNLSNFFKTMRSQCGAITQLAASAYNYTTSCANRSTNPIQTITLTPSAGTFAAGSAIYLYGIY